MKQGVVKADVPRTQAIIEVELLDNRLKVSDVIYFPSHDGLLTSAKAAVDFLIITLEELFDVAFLEVHFSVYTTERKGSAIAESLK